MKLIRTVACGIQAPALPQRLGDGSLELYQLEQTILLQSGFSQAF